MITQRRVSRPDKDQTQGLHELLKRGLHGDKIQILLSLDRLEGILANDLPIYRELVDRSWVFLYAYR